MRSYNHCLFEAERRAYQHLEQLLPADVEVVLYPNFDLFDDSKKTYLECDLIVVAKSFCAIVELKNWRGVINVAPTHWERNGSIVADPHRINNRKCKVLKTTLQQLLPHVTEVPYVQSIVVLTHTESEVYGESSVYSEVGAWPGTSQITFNGVEHLADYIRKRTAKDAKDGRNVLKDQSFRKIVERFDVLAEQLKEDYCDQIPGYRVVDELEHTEEYCSYLAEKVPALGGQRFRLRVFGELSDDPKTQAVQTRSLQELAALPHHENILPALSHPNEKNLVVEVSEWTDLRTLEACLLKEGRIQWETAAKIALGVARALDHIHNSSKMLVHRNVSPKSIILNSENVPKLTDFDLVYDPDASHTVYLASRPRTPYQPPELTLKGVDFKSDIYSWGMVFYEMMTGEPLVKSSNKLPADGLKREQLAKLPAEVPDAVRDLLIATIRVNVSERLEAGEVVARLEAALGVAKPAVVATHPAESSNTWQLLERISEGATSHVYAGDCLGERAVLKLYKREVGRDRCLQERDMLRLVNSPYVPRYKSFIQWADGRWCLIEEEVKGQKLRDLIDAGELASFSAFIEVTRQLLSALQGMHPKDEQDAAGVIHNDVNPNNILFDPVLSRATLIDFGAASPVGPITFRGTYGYISADLLENGEIDAQPKGDLYGLAVTLWEWATGRRPGDSVELDADSFPSLTPAQRIALSSWFAKATGGGSCGFTTAVEMLAEFEGALSAQESPFEETEETQQPVLQPEAGTAVCHAERFVEYLNSIHNISASNKNALAESQSVSEFFGDIYEPFPIVNEIYAILTTQEPAPVVILTGHAGDGKSTIALDVLKRLRRIPLTSPLPHPPEEREVAYSSSRQVIIVKDMSELSAEQRYEIFRDCLSDSSSAWLIVSNTGPLLGTFDAYYDRAGSGAIERQAIEMQLLEVLGRPIEGKLSAEKHVINVLDKTIFAVNLTKLDNVGIGTKVLQNIVQHPAWGSCSGCTVSDRCHIATNVAALKGAATVVSNRVRWVYRRLTSYEQRMTLRQMSAHLAYSVTAGIGCGEIRSTAPTLDVATEVPRAIAKVWFAEAFFGSSAPTASGKEESIHAIQLLKKLQFGTEASPEIERAIMEGKTAEWATLPAQIQPVCQVLQAQSRRPEQVVGRCSLRKLLYLFAELNGSVFPPARGFLSLFLQSPKLIELDEWQGKGALTLSSTQRRDLTRKTLDVLLEEYSGNSAGQYGNNYLYLTLRRSDRQVFQATQLVLARFDFSRFEIAYDAKNQLPKLLYKSQGAQAELLLTLPLLDYIIRRGQGDLEDGLDPIYLNHLEYFRAQLLSIDVDQGRDINLLRVGIDGKVDSYRYEYLADNNSLDLLE